MSLRNFFWDVSTVLNQFGSANQILRWRTMWDDAVDLAADRHGGGLPVQDLNLCG